MKPPRHQDTKKSILPAFLRVFVPSWFSSSPRLYASSAIHPPLSNPTFQISNLLPVLAAWLLLLPLAAAEEKKGQPKYKTESLRGRVVFLAGALEKKHGIK